MTPTQKLIEAAQQGHLEEVLRLIPLSDPKQDNSEALAQAARHGHVHCVQALIPVSDPHADNSFALWIAACLGHSDCVAQLIGVSGVTDGACRALNVAARNGHLECIRLLLPHHSQKQQLDAVSGPLLGNHIGGMKELIAGLKDTSALLPYFRQALYEHKLEIADVLFDAMPAHITSSMEIDYPEYCSRKQKMILEQHIGSNAALQRNQRKL